MSSARPTPRYSGVIASALHVPAHPRGAPHATEPQPVQFGPQLVGGALRPAPPRSRPASAGGGDGILSLGARQGGAEPLLLHPHAPSIEQPVPGGSARKPRSRARAVPVERRPWRVMIVSAAPGAAPRSFEVSRWMARAALGMAAVGLVLGGALIAALVIAVRSPDPAVQNEMLALEGALAATRDSLALARVPQPAAPAIASAGPAVEPPAMPVRRAPLPVVRESKATVPTSEGTARSTTHVPTAARAEEPDLDLPSDGVLSTVPRSVADLPVIGALVSGFSLARRHPVLHRVRPHLGVDLAAPRGTRVSAPSAGVVRFVGHRMGFGLVVELDHGAGVVTRYAHLRSAAVHAGETVRRGEAIAAVGTSGVTTGPHLHYEVMVHGRQVDPLRVRFGRVDSTLGPVLAGHPVPGAVPEAGAAPAAAPAATHEAAGPSAAAPPR